MIFPSIAAVLAVTTTLVTGAAVSKPQFASILPKFDYQSSFEILSCKTNPDRVAFFPFAANCDSICYKVTNPANGKSVNVLHVHQSMTDHALSAATWKTLTGTEPTTKSKGVKMTIENIPGEKCFDIMMDNPGISYSSSDFPPDDKVIVVGRPKKAGGGPLFKSCFVSGAEWSWVVKHVRWRNYWDVECKTGTDTHCGYIPPSIWLNTPPLMCPVGTPYPPSTWYKK